MNDAKDARPAPRAGPCPICGKPGVTEHRPFCSPRCRNIDLGRWFSGAYAVPAEEPPDDFDASG